MMNRIQKITSIAIVALALLTLSFAIYFYVFCLPSQSGPPWGGVEESNTAKVIQLQNRVKKADEFALRGSQLMADEEYSKGAVYYSRALISLPHAPMTRPRKAAYQTQFKRAFVRIFKG